MSAAKNNPVEIIIRGISTGNNTKNQDQAITPVSFSVIKTIVNNPKNPTCIIISC